MRIGLGYDVHKLVEGRQLIIGGVNIPHEKGLLGHSDADVLIHAIMDSMLGALALGDIGKHFPDTDERYKGADSMKLLKCVNDLINEKGYEINNIDSIIIAQSPKMAPHIENMRKNIASVLNTDIENISVKATTEEGLGFTGSKEGISSRYVSHALQAYGESIRRTTKKQGGTVDSLDFQKVLAYKIPVPPLDVQNRIVNVLDNFEKICSDLNIGLPAEIEARQKQYEYYRDKLLSFKEHKNELSD